MTTDNPAWWPRDPARRIAIAVLLGLGAGSIFVAAWSLRNGGIGWDSQFDTGAALEARAVDSSFTLEEAYATVRSTSEFYGVILYQLADLVHRVATGSTEPLGPDDAVTYQYQGAVTLGLSVISVSAFAAALATALRSLLAGAFAFALILATPLWLGMSHVNFKDMPVAAGITLITAGLIFSLTLPGTRRAALVGGVLAGSGGAITLATRGGALALIGALVGGSAAVAIGWRIGSRRLAATTPVLITSAVAVASALVVTWLTNPIARIDLPQWLADSAEYARSVSWELPPMRVAGVDVQGDALPWWYVPAWLGAQLPVLTLLAVCGGTAVVAFTLIRRRRLVSAETTLALVPIALQAMVLPAAMFLGGAVIYDGLRHLLFMLPALLAFPAIALAVLERRFANADARRRTALLVSTVVIVAASLFASIRWAPYAYAFVNPVAGVEKDSRNWDLDYWGVSGREGVRRLQELGFERVHVEPSASVGIPFGGIAGPTVSGPNTGAYVFLRWNGAEDYGCTVLFTIERDGHALGEGARCEPD